ncbi:hypothetical protein [Streptomyces sp. NPDC059874]|uniref:hypothetical protein n=1 Tax=Streptomyces sp. NPDC059874 TaxID=3346983 RepID=UPI00365B3850
MGYDVHVTRAEFWWDEDAPGITADEWAAVVAADPGLEAAGAATAAGITYESPWLARTVPGGAWLDWRDGRIVAKNPDRTVLDALRKVARALGGGARVQGDDGEPYD